MSIISALRPISRIKKEKLEEIQPYFEKSDFKYMKRLIKQNKIGIAQTSLKVSENIVSDQFFPIFTAKYEDNEILHKIKLWNDVIEQEIRKEKYLKFAPTAEEKIKKFIAPHIVGFDDIKEAVILQLFAKEKAHILLLGDPSTGKTDILRSINDIAPISSFGLGSGTSSAGLTAAIKGKEITQGLLPMANGGICCIDELNLMRHKDRGSLLNAMEKGFVSYDKGSTHMQFDAHVSVLATANPKGDRFVGTIPSTWLKQIPFDPALLTRFHLVFFIRKPNNKEFIDIAKRIVADTTKKLDIGDMVFLRDYVEFSQMIDVEFDNKLKTQIVDYIAKLKTDEKDFLVEISPRTIIGIMRLAKASARMELRQIVEQKDIDKIFKLVKNSLYVRDKKVKT